MPERKSSARVPALMIAVFFFTFAGPGAIQFYIRNVTPEDWSPLKVTSILAVLYAAFALWRFLVVPSQHLLGDKWALALGALGYVLMPAALLVTANYYALLVIAVFWAWGAAALWQTGPVWLYDATGERRRGLWAGVLYMLVFAALYLGARVQGLAAAAEKRELLLWIAIAPGILAFGLAMMLPAREARSQPLSARAALSMLSDRRVAFIGIILCVSATSYGLLLGSFRDKIQDAYGPAALGRIVGYYLLIRMAVSVAGGHFGDVLARKSVIAAVFLAGGVAIAAAAAMQEIWAFSVASACLGLVGGIAPISATAFSAEWFAPEKRSLGLAASFFWQDGAMVLSLLGGQYIAQASGGFRVPFAVFAALFIVSSGVALALPEARRAEAAAEAPR